MIITRTVKEINTWLDLYIKDGKKVGFVPTMGALHKGHLSLIECSKKNNDITVSSIFVNPTQFNNQEDLKKYPRTEIQDIEMLNQAGCDIVFIPTQTEMYPEKDKRSFDFKGLDKVMEGKYRKNHFNGVAQIVSILFEIIKPSRAYFGKKDFQQVAIIKYLNKNYLQHLNIEIVVCPIMREEDGLAMSSRNRLLKPDRRAITSLISKTLLKYKNNYSHFSVEELKTLIQNEINNSPLLQVEYIDIVDDTTLKTVQTIIEGKTTACIAVFAGEVRLIDNISF